MTICDVCLISFPGPKCPCASNENLVSLLTSCTEPSKLSPVQVSEIEKYYFGRKRNVPKKFNKGAVPTPAPQNLEEALRLATARAEKAEQELATLHKNAQAYAQKAEKRIGYLQTILRFFGISY